MINVVGLGYIGLPTALILAQNGNEVCGSDINKELVEKLNNGEVTFDEEGLKELYKDAIDNGITFKDNIISTDIYIVAVPTPYIESSKKVDLEYVIDAVGEIIKKCNFPATIIIESTISPGSIDNHIKPLIESKGFKIGEEVHIVHAPERIIPGNMIFELKNNSRTIGADSNVIAEKVKHLYSSFCKGDIILTSIKAAEMSKVVENTFRDINIAFANELARICNKGGMDVYEIISIANKHPRVNILKPGPGVGGHCIPIDPWFLVGEFPEETRLIKQARIVNSQMPEYIISYIDKLIEEYDIKNYSSVGFYGLTYKPDIDDLRESPAIQIDRVLKNKKIDGYVMYDPLVKNVFTNQITNFDDFLKSTDLIVVLMNHKHLLENWSKIKDKIILDTQNCLENNSNVHKL